jgi:uncharacterized protein (DUF58 family)
MIKKQGIIFIVFSFALIHMGSAFYNMPMIITGAIFLIYLAIYSLYFNKKIDSFEPDIIREFDIKSAPTGREIKYKIKIPKTTPYDFILEDIIPQEITESKQKFIDSRKYTGKNHLSYPYYEMDLVLNSEQRGFFPIGPSKIIFHDNLNLLSREKILSNIDNILFYLSISSGKKLDISLRKKVSEFTQGLRKSWYKGAGTNFIDLRAYAPGDDIRLIDWKTTAKKESLHVKEFEEEKRQRVLILLDVGKTMFAGSPKIIMDSAIKSMMLISHVILAHGDYLGCATFSNTIKSYLKFDIGKKQYKKMINLLSGISFGEDTNIISSLSPIKTIFKKNALVMLISTLSNKEESIKIIRKLKANGNAIIILYPFEPLFSREQAVNDLEKIILSSLQDKFKIDASETKNSFRKIGVPLLVVGPKDFENKTLKLYIKEMNKNLRAIYS